MKRIVCFIVLSLTLLSCSKPAEPDVELADIGNKAKSQGFTIDNKVEINHAANVTVVDADTGLAIEGATVRARIDADEAGTTFIEGIEIGDGEYYLPTEDLKGSYYAGAMAEDYHGNASYTPSFPYEIKLKSGETVTVSGEIIDEFHQPVTRGVMNLRVDKDWGKNWTKFYLCSVEVNQHGKFKLENIPANIKDVYAKYECFGEPAVDFKEQSFDIANEDVYLKLQMPSKLIIKGKVIYSSGEPVSGAWVWVEKVVGEELNSFNKLLQNKRSALDKVSFCTQADGEFELKLNTIKDKYSIKAYHPSSLPAYKGPYSDDNPPTEFVELVIKNDGARLAGRIFNSKNEPITNCKAKYVIWIPSGNNSRSGSANNLELDIDENGDYISGIVPIGIDEVDFSAPGYSTIKKPVTIIKNKQTFVDVKFNSNPTKIMVTGTVYSTDTKLPISGVTIKQRNVKEIKKTDDNGQFVFDTKHKNIEFSAPGYGTFIISFNSYKCNFPDSYESDNWASHPKFYLSPSGSVRLVIKDKNGKPLDGNIVNMRYDVYKNRNWVDGVSNYKFKNGEVVFKNLSSHHNSANFTVKDLKNKKDLMVINNVDVKPGEEVVVYTNLPPTGSLVLEFESSFNNRALELYLSSRSIHGMTFWKSQFKEEGQTLKLNDIPSNKYTLQVGNGASNNNLIYTNIFILKDTVTTIKIDNNKENLGSIKGSVKTIDGKSMTCDIQVTAQENPNVTCSLHRYYENNFIIEQLPKRYLYTLKVIPNGNATNIVVKNLEPDGVPVEIVLPEAFAVTGNIVDEAGNPLTAQVLMNRHVQNISGEFKLYPVFPGKYNVSINVEGYAKQYLQLNVSNSDVDLGDLVIKDKGLTITGRFVDPDARAINISWAKLIVNSKYDRGVIVDSDGYFKIKCVTAGNNIKIKYRTGEKALGVVSADLDLGDIIIEKEIIRKN